MYVYHLPIWIIPGERVLEIMHFVSCSCNDQALEP